MTKFGPEGIRHREIYTQTSLANDTSKIIKTSKMFFYEIAIRYLFQVLTSLHPGPVIYSISATTITTIISTTITITLTVSTTLAITTTPPSSLLLRGILVLHQVLQYFLSCQVLSSLQPLHVQREQLLCQSSLQSSHLSLLKTLS